MIDEVLTDAEDRMMKTLDAVQRELDAVRSGHAQVGLIDHVKVEYYGAQMSLNQMATVAAPEPRLLTIQPWDKGALNAIEKALLKSDVGLTPSNDGQIIRLVIPPLTEARRKDMIKLVHTRVEDGHVAVRNVRRDAIDRLRKLTNEKEISEDDQHKAQDQLQKLTDRFVATINERGKDKEAELMEV